jgi:hypothetical protein
LKVYNTFLNYKDKWWKNQKREKLEEDEFIQKEQKNIKLFLLLNVISFSIFYLLWLHCLKIEKTFLKCKDNGSMSKDLKLQNTNLFLCP